MDLCARFGYCKDLLRSVFPEIMKQIYGGVFGSPVTWRRALTFDSRVCWSGVEPLQNCLVARGSFAAARLNLCELA